MYGSLLRLLLRLSMVGRASRFRADLRDPAAAQRERLRRILARNADCEAGRLHDFARIDGVDDFRSAVPLSAWEEIAPSVERMRRGEGNVLTSDPVEMFAVTSGTLSEPKFVPVTRAFTLEHHVQHRLWMARLVADHPTAADGYLHTVVSPAEEGRTEGGVPYGSASGKRYRDQALPIRVRHAAPYAVTSVRDYDARVLCALAFMLCRELTCVTSVNPSSLVLLGERLRDHGALLLSGLEHRARTGAGGLEEIPGLDDDERARLEPFLRIDGRRVRELRERLDADGALLPRTAWPSTVLCTWHGGNAPFHLARLPDLWGDRPARCLGLRASEGMFSIPLADHTAEGVLATGGHFMEFLPEDVEPAPDAETLLARELEPGRRYRLVVTTSGGLYRYDLGDIVEATALMERTPVVAFLHKAGKVVSITGEKVTEAHVVAAARGCGLAEAAAGFTVTPRFSEPPRLALSVEPLSGDDAPDADAWAEAFDRELRAVNIEYDAKRASGRLGMPATICLAPGSFNLYRKRMVDAGRPEGQIKPPHLMRDPDFPRELDPDAPVEAS